MLPPHYDRRGTTRTSEPQEELAMTEICFWQCAFGLIPSTTALVADHRPGRKVRHQCAVKFFSLDQVRHQVLFFFKKCADKLFNLVTVHSEFFWSQKVRFNQCAEQIFSPEMVRRQVLFRFSSAPSSLFLFLWRLVGEVPKQKTESL